jgi:hypothetical protein
MKYLRQTITAGNRLAATIKYLRGAAGTAWAQRLSAVPSVSACSK